MLPLAMFSTCLCCCTNLGCKGRLAACSLQGRLDVVSSAKPLLMPDFLLLGQAYIGLRSSIRSFNQVVAAWEAVMEP